MNTKAIIFSFVLLGAAGTAHAQKQKFTLAEAVNGLRSNLAIKNVSGFGFTRDGSGYTQLLNNAIVYTNLKTAKTDTLLAQKSLAANENLKNTSVGRVRLMDDGGAYVVSGNKVHFLEAGRGTLGYRRTLALQEGAENVTLVPKSNYVLYTVKNNVYLNQNGVNIALTNDQNENIINGQTVHRSEFGISKGLFPSPVGNAVAFYRMDQTMVADYPIIDWSVTPARSENIKYPMAGGTSHHVTLGVYNINTGKTTFLQTTGDPEQYLTAVTWAPDGRSIFVGVLNRAQNHLRMNQYDATTGALIKTHFEETSDKYVEPQHDLLFFPGSTTDFIWQSQRTGYNHLFHYNTEKGLVGQLTKGDWEVTEVVGIHPKKNDIYFLATKDSPLERHIYRVNKNTLKMERLDTAAGMHTATMSDDGSWIYDTYSNADTPRNVSLINTATKNVQTLLSAPNPLVKYQRPDIRNVTLRADDGTPLYGKIILPTDFNPAKKYPAIVYLYNGPHVQLVTNSFPASGNLWYEYMAQRGYVVFTMDGRGSGNRGLQFEQATFRNLGTTEMNDQLQGVAYLRSLPYVDAGRLGVHGWSFGGYMTTSLMLRHPDVFRVGVAGGPVIDWRMYEIMYTERYMDTPAENPEGYKNAALFDKVQNLKGKLLMIHGTQDDVVVWQHSVNFIKAAVDKGVQLDYFIYPGHPHNVSGPDRVHLMQKVTDYFDLYLKNNKEADQQ